VFTESLLKNKKERLKRKMLRPNTELLKEEVNQSLPRFVDVSKGIAHFDQSSDHCGTCIHRAGVVSANTGLDINATVNINIHTKILGIYLMDIGLL